MFLCFVFLCFVLLCFVLFCFVHGEEEKFILGLELGKKKVVLRGTVQFDETLHCFITLRFAAFASSSSLASSVSELCLMG